MRGRPDTALFAGVVAFFVVLQGIGLWSGAAGLTFGRGVAAATLSLSLITAVFLATRFNNPVDDAGDGSAAASGASPWPVRILATATLGWTAFVWARLWVLAWRRQPFDWDGLYYHIPAIHGWVQQGRVGWLASPPDIPFVNYPMGVEATTFFMHALHGSSRLVNACNLWYWPLGVLSLVVLARCLGARPAWAWLAGALWVSAPLVVTQSVTNYTDVSQAATILSALAASLLLVFSHEGSRLWRFLLWGGAVGLMAGAKGSGLPAAVIIVGGVVIMLLLRERDQVRAWWPSLLLSALLAVAAGGYWYLRSIFHTGNPVYPIQVKIGHNVIFPGYDHIAFSEANLPDWLAAYPTWLRMPVSWLQFDAPIVGSSPVGGLGYLWLAAGVPATLALGLWLWRRRHADAAVWPFVVLGGLTMILLGAQTSNWWSRFTVWLIGLGLPCLAALLDRWQVTARSRLTRLVVAMVALAAVGLAVWESGRSLFLEEADGRRVDASGQVSYPTSLQRIAGGMDTVPGLEQFWAAETIGRTGFGRLGTLLNGVLCQPLAARRILLLPRTPTTADMAALRDQGAQWVFWDVEGAGDLPDSLRPAIAEELSFTPTGGPAYLFLKLR